MTTPYLNLPREAHVRMADLVSSRKHQRKGITGLSEMTIRRLIAKGKFPKPRKYPDSQLSFFVYGEILDWLDKQNAEG